MPSINFHIHNLDPQGWKATTANYPIGCDINVWYVPVRSHVVCHFWLVRTADLSLMFFLFFCLVSRYPSIPNHSPQRASCAHAAGGFTPRPRRRTARFSLRSKWSWQRKRLQPRLLGRLLPRVPTAKPTSTRSAVSAGV
jgi:hypothetical protein